MSKFNRATATTRGATSAVQASVTPNAVTYEGGAAHTRDVKGELFQLAVVNLVGENTFYESGSDRDTRYAQLVRQSTLDDPDWTARLLGWLRSTANLRSASLVGAAEFTRARLDAKQAGLSRQVVSSVLQRADEPGELLAYWTSRYGKAIPKPLKRGVADAATRLYGEHSLLKYDTASKGFRFADVIDLTHPIAKAPWQDTLFRHALDRRRNRVTEWDGDALPTLRANARLRATVAAGDYSQLLDAESLRNAGMTWEDALSLAGSKVNKARLWESLIPSMGYMALLRNLRNFDEAGVSDRVAWTVMQKLVDPEQVARSRQFPYRFLSAYLAAPSDRWKHPLNLALDLATQHIPELPGRSLILVDTSASMRTPVSKDSKISAVMAGALLGVSLASRNVGRADLVGFASGVFRHDVPRGGSALRETERFVGRVGEVGHGTDIWGSLRQTFNGHDRVFIVTDMQTINDPYGHGGVGVDGIVPRNVPVYGFNLGGYRTTAYASGQPNRHEFGGLNDATLRAIPLLERGENSGWPF